MLGYLIGAGLLLLGTVGNSLLAVTPETVFGVNISAAILGSVCGLVGTTLIRVEKKRIKRRKALKKARRRYKHNKSYHYRSR